MKRLTACSLWIVLAILALSSITFASETIQPRWTHIALIAADVTSDSIDGTVGLYDADNYATISLTLQKYNSGWHDQGTWSGSAYGVASASGDLNLPRGTYRIKIDVTVRSSPAGSILETTTIYTEEKSIY